MPRRAAGKCVISALVAETVLLSDVDVSPSAGTAHTSVVSLSNWPTSLPTALVAPLRWQIKTIVATEFHCISL